MVQKSVDLGVIRRVDVGYEQNGVKESYATSDDYSLMNLSNVHLNEKQIDALQSYLLKQRKQVTDAPNGPKKSAQIAMIRSMAIAALLGDVNTRSIISE